MINSQNLPIKESLEQIQNFAKSELQVCKSSSKVETAQIPSNQLKLLKIVVADLQKKVGSLSTEARQHVGSLRMGSPKARPKEDDTKLINETLHIFNGGKWYPISSSDKGQE
jgi:hypothetical protein